MIRLLRWVVMRRLLEERFRTLLVVLGVGLGVAVVVSIQLASRSAMASFAQSVDAIAGRANLEVVARSGALDERLFPRVLATPGIRAAAPGVQVLVRARAGGPAARAGLVDSIAARRSARSRAGDSAAVGVRTTLREAWPETVLLLGLDVLRERAFARFDPSGAPEADTASRRLASAILTDPRGAAITASLARRLGLGPGDTLTILASGRPEPLVVRGMLGSQALERAASGSVAIVDIATAQEVLGRFGVIDRIDAIVDPDQLDRVRRALAQTLPTDVLVQRPQARTRQVENMVQAFRLNLTALSFVALLVSTALIFNAVAMSALRLRREIGILRSLGVRRSGILRLFVAEGLVLGALGSVVGVLLGTALARLALGSVARTLTDLYLVPPARTLEPDPLLLLEGLGLGILVSLVSALLPAWEAAATPPGVTMRQGLLIEGRRMPVGRWSLLGVLTLLAAVGTGVWVTAERRAWGGFVSALLAVVGFALLAPAASLACERVAAPLARRWGGIEMALGTRLLRDAVARISVVVAAVMVAVAMTVALTLMVRSFRATVDTWISQSIRGDLYAEPYGHRETGDATAMPEAFVAAARRLPGVRGVDTFRGAEIQLGGRTTYAIGLDLDVQRRFGSLRFVRGAAGPILARARTRGEVIVTESFAHHFRVGPGDSLDLDVPAGHVRLRVAGVEYDYATDLGIVYMDAGLFARLWRDARTESMALYLEPGADPDAVRARLLRLAGPDLVLAVTPNRALRARALAVFDQTFQITWALQGITVLVAVLGVIGTLTALVLQRGREIAVLRAIGAKRGQVRAIVIWESLWIGVIGSVLGCLCGIALAIVLVQLINKQYFGWTIRLVWDGGVLVRTIVIVVATAALAGIVPARFAATRVAAEAMRTE